MATEKQIEANRKNAKKSTGPKTAAGKSVVAKNAVKHGLLSAEALLLWESNETLEELRKGLIDTLQPVGVLESIFADRIVALTWRLRRAGQIESCMLEQKSHSFAMEFHDKIFNYLTIDGPEQDKQLIEHGFKKETLERLRDKICRTATQNADNNALGMAIAENMALLNNIQRYEVTLERSLFKAIHELQRLQGYRLGKDTRLPVAIDFHGDAPSS